MFKIHICSQFPPSACCHFIVDIRKPLWYISKCRYFHSKLRQQCWHAKCSIASTHLHVTSPLDSYTDWNNSLPCILESKYLWASNWHNKKTCTLLLYCEFSEFLPLVSSLISQASSIDTNVHNRYESHRKLATCVHVNIHPKQTVHALCWKMMNFYTVYQSSMYHLFQCFMSACQMLGMQYHTCIPRQPHLSANFCSSVAFLVLSASHQASTCLYIFNV